VVQFPPSNRKAVGWFTRPQREPPWSSLSLARAVVSTAWAKLKSQASACRQLVSLNDWQKNFSFALVLYRSGLICRFQQLLRLGTICLKYYLALTKAKQPRLSLSAPQQPTMEMKNTSAPRAMKPSAMPPICVFVVVGLIVRSIIFGTSRYSKHMPPTNMAIPAIWKSIPVKKRLLFFEGQSKMFNLLANFRKKPRLSVMFHLLLKHTYL